MIYTAAGLAILCLVVAGVLDLVFKMYAARARSRGMLIFGIGCVWATLHCLAVFVAGNALEFTPATFGWGLAAALCLTLSNILLVESMGHLPVSAASTIYRLNTVPLTLMAFLFLGEGMDWLRGGGIALGILTVLLLYHPGSEVVSDERRRSLFIIVIIAASIIRALYGIFTKAGIEAGVDPDVLILFAAAGWGIGGLLYAGIREHRLVITRDKMRYSAVAGVLVYAIVWLLTTALALGDANVVIPISNMGFVAAFILSLMMKFERMTWRKLVAIPMAMASVIALTLSIG